MEYKFRFISLDRSFDVGIACAEENKDFERVVSVIKWGFFAQDVADNAVYFVRSSKALYENLCLMAKDLAGLNWPKINALPAWVKGMGEGAFFAVATNCEVSIEVSLAIQAKLDELQNGAPCDEAMKHIEEMCRNIFPNYSMVSRDGTRRVYISEPNKALRRCRYCGRTIASGATFKKVGHTISEGLGNKNIINNDECDRCNEYFGREIEQAFISYVDPLRVFFGVQAKEHKITKIKGDKYEMEGKNVDGRNVFNIKVYDEPDNRMQENGKELRLRLKHGGKIVLQNIYKSLVKYAYGIIPDDKLVIFEATTKWLLGETEVEQLPLIRMTYLSKFEESPRVVVYIRHTDNDQLPRAIGEFHVMNLIFVYIIPTFADDESRFRDARGWQPVLDIMTHWRCLNWRWLNFSSTHPEQVAMNFIFKQGE